MKSKAEILKALHICADEGKCSNECPYYYGGHCRTDMYKDVIEYMEKQDQVDHPNHYNREGAMECIEEMRMVFGDEATATFCLMNTWKYRYRAIDKNGFADINKSDDYMRKCKEIRDDFKNKKNDRYGGLALLSDKRICGC